MPVEDPQWSICRPGSVASASKIMRPHELAGVEAEDGPLPVVETIPLNQERYQHSV